MGMRGIGFVSTIVLARLLAPSDFGLIAMATATTALVENMGLTSVDLALVKKNVVSKEDFDSAWTLRAIIGFVMAAVVALMAPLAAKFFSEQRVMPIMLVLSVRIVLTGFENFPTVEFQRALAFGREFRFTLACKLIAISLSIAAAVVIRNYWALVIGMLAGTITQVGLGYVVTSYRPRISFAKVRHILSFSLWLQSINLARFILDKVDQAIVGRISTSAVTGQYFMGSDISSMVTAEIGLPVSRTLVPIYARLADRADAYKEAVIKAVSAVGSACFAAGFGLAAIAPEFVRVVLGDKWTESIPYLTWLGMAATFSILLDFSSGSALIVVGRERRTATLYWVRCLCIAVTLALGATYNSPLLIAKLRFAMGLILFPVIIHSVCKGLLIPSKELYFVIWRPLLAAIVMFFGVRYIGLFPVNNLILLLILKICYGATIFSTTLVLLWQLQGRPQGFEEEIMNIGKQIYKGYFSKKD